MKFLNVQLSIRSDARQLYWDFTIPLGKYQPLWNDIWSYTLIRGLRGIDI